MAQGERRRMFLFQAYATKKKSDEDNEEETSQLGIKIKNRARKPNARLEMLYAHEDVAAQLSETDKAFKEKGISQFISTLTPGTQNAIYAASFAWGYENAAKYVKNAMKLDEVKNAADMQEKSRAVIESIKSQAEGQAEKSKESSSFVWSFYNEDLKETQAQAATSESISEKARLGIKQEETYMPLSASEAVAMGIAGGTQNPALTYCAGAATAVDEMRLNAESARKKEEFAQLVRVGEAGAEKNAAVAAQEAAAKQQEEALKLAIRRRDELIKEYDKTEKELKKALDTLKKIDSDSRERLKRVHRLLPKDMRRLINFGDRKFWKRALLKKLIVRWIAFCRSGRNFLSSLPLGKLAKLVSFFSLLKR